MNAVRAYFEWIPIRQVDLDDNLRVWRSFQLGSLMDLIILDTRNYDRSITSLGKLVGRCFHFSFEKGARVYGRKYKYIYIYIYIREVCI